MSPKDKRIAAREAAQVFMMVARCLALGLAEVAHEEGEEGGPYREATVTLSNGMVVQLSVVKDAQVAA